ncbi:MAG: FAD-binding protein [Acidobacteria bacterium]|nr:MAG: FAD-binding protein [Acidobacteriota bacterium]
MPAYETHDHDVLVVGAGGAGLRAAIAAAAQGVSVGLVCKSLLGSSRRPPSRCRSEWQLSV